MCQKDADLFSSFAGSNRKNNNDILHMLSNEEVDFRGKLRRLSEKIVSERCKAAQDTSTKI